MRSHSSLELHPVLAPLFISIDPARIKKFSCRSLSKKRFQFLPESTACLNFPRIGDGEGSASLLLDWSPLLLFLPCEKGQISIGKAMVNIVARQGRQLQRYTSCGGRLVVGCIPYKLKMDDPFADDIAEAVQVLVISSQKGHGMMFPKGGWESDETMKQAASREALEEAGVEGQIESNLGRWMYKSNRYNVFYEGIMFPLNVTEELAYWPEMEVRKRRWVTVAEAREGCQHFWMREALEILLQRLERTHKEQNSYE